MRGDGGLEEGGRVVGMTHGWVAVGSRFSESLEPSQEGGKAAVNSYSRRSTRAGKYAEWAREWGKPVDSKSNSEKQRGISRECRDFVYGGTKLKIEWRIPEEWLPLRGRKTGVFTGRRTLGGGGASVKGKTTLAPSAEDRWIGTNKPRNRNGIRFFPRSLRPRDTKPIYPLPLYLPKRARVFSTG